MLESVLRDLNEFGRLLVLKDHLLSLVDRSERLEINTLGLFQLKDFCALDSDLAYELDVSSQGYDEKLL